MGVKNISMGVKNISPLKVRKVKANRPPRVRVKKVCATG